MITNIVDRRSNKYKWKEVWGVIEPTWADNRCEGADHMPYDGCLGSVQYTTESMLLSDLLVWASKFDGNYTLYISESDPMEIVNPKIKEDKDVDLPALFDKVDQIVDVKNDTSLSDEDKDRIVNPMLINLFDTIASFEVNENMSKEYKEQSLLDGMAMFDMEDLRSFDVLNKMTLEIRLFAVVRYALHSNKIRFSDKEVLKSFKATNKLINFFVDNKNAARELASKSENKDSMLESYAKIDRLD